MTISAAFVYENGLDLLIITTVVCYRPVHGLIFLFKYLQHEEPSGPVVTDDRLEKIYFAKQVRNLIFSL